MFTDNKKLIGSDVLYDMDASEITHAYWKYECVINLYDLNDTTIKSWYNKTQYYFYVRDTPHVEIYRNNTFVSFYEVTAINENISLNTARIVFHTFRNDYYGTISNIETNGYIKNNLKYEIGICKFENKSLTCLTINFKDVQ